MTDKQPQWRHLIGMGGAVHLETTLPPEEDANHTYAVSETGEGLARYEVDGEWLKLGETRGEFRVRLGEKGSPLMLSTDDWEAAASGGE